MSGRPETAGADIDAEYLQRCFDILKGAWRDLKLDAAITLELPAFPAGAEPRALRVGESFRLSSFEFWLLLVCVGQELDSELAASLLESTQGGGARLDWLARLLPGAHWSALAPESPLRRFHLLRLESGENWLRGRLAVPERILHYVLGRACAEPQLEPYLLNRRPAPIPDPGASASKAGAAEIPARQALLRSWLQGQSGAGKALWLQFAHVPTALAALSEAAVAEAMHVSQLDAAVLYLERDGLLRQVALIQRESVLERMLFVLDLSELDFEARGSLARQNLILFANRCGDSVAFLAPIAPDLPGHALEALHSVVLPAFSRREQAELWTRHLPPESLNGTLPRLLASFPLNPAQIESIARDSLAEAGPAGSRASQGSAAPALEESVWRLAREALRSGPIPGMARIEPKAVWNDLVLPAQALESLRTLCSQVRHRHQVHEAWGFERKSSRGLGIAALFHGASGTGKTLAAEVVASTLGLDLYLVDLSRVVSKYIGETEKNLARIFDAAQASGGVLFFDEADALFGKRTEVRDSHDRYANIEVSYLLQRIEAYSGLSILTSNLKDSIDEAFLRRIRFSLHFPFPDAASRQRIWDVVFPSELPREGLRPERLAQLHVSGGAIRNIALHAAFAAAEAGSPAVGMRHLERAAKIEYQKMQKPLTDAELRGWTDDLA
jgi:ATPase family protein associated with various cellular activities (AAA)/winged helix domain-containing protein